MIRRYGWYVNWSTCKSVSWVLLPITDAFANTRTVDFMVTHEKTKVRNPRALPAHGLVLFVEHELVSGRVLFLVLEMVPWRVL